MSYSLGQEVYTRTRIRSDDETIPWHIHGGYAKFGIRPMTMACSMITNAGLQVITGEFPGSEISGSTDQSHSHRAT